MLTTGCGTALVSTTKTWTTGDTAIAPWSSVTLAVSSYAPAGTFVQRRKNGPMGLRVGKLVVTPRLLVPSKNSTVWIVKNPSVSKADATIRMFPGAGKTAPFQGALIWTLGGWLVATGPSLSKMSTTALLGTPML